ncbi:hypothetical protein BAL199_00095 [alpha proteobacterium BAL199]|nr:hypothetical protein BAL199_00095 [alpha proteobacterium BAL199]
MAVRFQPVEQKVDSVSSGKFGCDLLQIGKVGMIHQTRRMRALHTDRPEAGPGIVHRTHHLCDLTMTLFRIKQLRKMPQQVLPFCPQSIARC